MVRGIQTISIASLCTSGKFLDRFRVFFWCSWNAGSPFLAVSMLLIGWLWVFAIDALDIASLTNSGRKRSIPSAPATTSRCAILRWQTIIEERKKKREKRVSGEKESVWRERARDRLNRSHKQTRSAAFYSVLGDETALKSHKMMMNPWELRRRYFHDALRNDRLSKKENKSTGIQRTFYECVVLFAACPEGVLCSPNMAMTSEKQNKTFLLFLFTNNVNIYHYCA